VCCSWQGCKGQAASSIGGGNCSSGLLRCLQSGPLGLLQCHVGEGIALSRDEIAKTSHLVYCHLYPIDFVYIWDARDVSSVHPA
jgi:hypothetical protein